MPTRPAAPSTVLGLSVGPEAIDAVLLQPTPDGLAVVGRLARQRGGVEQAVDAEKLAMALPGLRGSDSSDYTLEVGDGAASAAQFQASEFGLPRKGADTAVPVRSRPFLPQLREILHEARASGHDVDRLAFVIAHPDAAAVPFYVGEPESGKGRKGAAPTDPKHLLARLKDAYSGPLDAGRVAFLPLAPLDERPRMLGVVADPAEPVSESLRLLADGGETLPPAVTLDTETAVLADLVRQGARPSAGERSALVRVGHEDTLVLFFDGPDLLHVERLRSLTAYDLPDTVASRVLLQLDQKKVGDLQHVYLAVAGRPEPLVDKFRTFFPDAAVEPATHLLAAAGVALPDADDDANDFKSGALLAVAAGLAAMAEAPRTLLPAELLRTRRRALPPVLPTVLAGLLLVALVAFTVVRFVGARAEVKALEAELIANPPILPSDDPDRLQARVDSLNRAYATYTRALDVLDSLLVGSDQWTQAMRLVTRSVESTGGTWLIGWAPDPPNVRLTGQSISRTQIVDLTRRLGASIEMLEYTDVGPRRVYTFDMLMPVDAQMPEVARFLREVAGSSPAVRDSLAAAMVADTTAYVVDPVGHTH